MGFGCKPLTRGNTSVFEDNRGFISALVQDPATEEITFRRCTIVAPEATNYFLNQMYGGDYAITDLNDTSGRHSIVSTTENKTDQSGSITFACDTIYNATTPSALPKNVSLNMLTAMMTGQGVEDGGTYLQVVGTPGNLITCTDPIKEAKWLLYEDIYKVVSGQDTDSNGLPTLKQNPVILDYIKHCKPCMLELATSPTLGGADDETYRYSAMQFKDVMFNEGAPNTYSANYEGLADVWKVNKPIAQGFSDKELDVVAIEGTDSIYTINANYILTVAGGATETPPSVPGVAGDICVVINSTDDTVELYKFATTWIDVPVTSTMGKGFRAWTSEAHTALDGTGGVSGDVQFMAVKTAGTTGNAIVAKYGNFFTIPYKEAIVDDLDRTTFWRNININD